MRIFVAGASGAIGQPLVKLLRREGHEVSGMARTATGANRLHRLGAEPVQVDAFDRDAVQAALKRAEPAVVIDQITSLPQNLAELVERLPTDRTLRLEGGGNVFAAAEELGVERYIQQASGFYLAAKHGLADEAAPLRVDAPGVIGASSTMYTELERRVLASPRMQGVALRYGFFYGPGTWYWTDGSLAELAKRQQAPIIGEGKGVWSFVHIEDAAVATVAALSAAPGIYNIVDDDPIMVRESLTDFARWVGAPEPAQLTSPAELDRVGAEGVYYHNQLSGASNSKAKAMLAFKPRPLAWKTPPVRS